MLQLLSRNFGDCTALHQCVRPFQKTIKLGGSRSALCSKLCLFAVAALWQNIRLHDRRHGQMRSHLQGIPRARLHSQAFMAAVHPTPCCAPALAARVRCSETGHCAAPCAARRDSSNAGPAASGSLRRSQRLSCSRRSASVCRHARRIVMAAAAVERASASVSGRLGELRQQKK